MNLARKIGKYDPRWNLEIEEEGEENENAAEKDGGEVSEQRKKHKKGKKGKRKAKKKERKEISQIWFTFLRRAFVGTKDDEDLKEHFWQR